MNYSPQISVIMPVYNAEKFLQESIESILNQTFSDFELIIIDDASTDNSSKIIQKYLFDKRIRSVRRYERSGIVRNLNLGLEIAKSDIIARMDGDDISLPERLERQVREFMNHPELALVGTFAEKINAEGKSLGMFRKPETMEAILQSIFLFSPFIHPSVMYRKDLIRAVGGYREEYLYSEDWDLWCRLLYHGYQAMNIPKVLLKYRIHKNSSFHHAKKIAWNNFRIRKEMIHLFQLKIRFKEWFFMWAHFILGNILTGYQKQNLESWFKERFYG